MVKLAAHQRLLQALPYFRQAILNAEKTAGKDGWVEMGILAVNSDGSGNIELQCDCKEFFADLATLLDAPPHTREDTYNVNAVKFLQHLQFGGINTSLDNE